MAIQNMLFIIWEFLISHFYLKRKGSQLNINLKNNNNLGYSNAITIKM